MAIEKIDIELTNRRATIRIDEESLLELVQECVNAIRATHGDFAYSGDLTDVAVHGYGINVHLASERWGTPDLSVNIYWDDINKIQPFEFLELSGGAFPDNIGNRAALNVQKRIVKKIWELHKHGK